MRDVQVWIDGQKEAEQIDGFSNYTFLNKSLSLSAEAIRSPSLRLDGINPSRRRASRSTSSNRKDGDPRPAVGDLGSKCANLQEALTFRLHGAPARLFGTQCDDRFHAHRGPRGNERSR